MQIITTQDTTIPMIYSSSKMLNSKVIRASSINHDSHNILDPPTNQAFFNSSINKLPTMSGNVTKVNNPLMQAPIVIHKMDNKIEIAQNLTRCPSIYGETNS